MNDLDTSIALAQAIGWQADQMRLVNGALYCYTGVPYKKAPAVFSWHKFDHTDWSVIGPIAARLGVSATPWFRSDNGREKPKLQLWTAISVATKRGRIPRSTQDPSLQRALADAVILALGSRPPSRKLAPLAL